MIRDASTTPRPPRRRRRCISGAALLVFLAAPAWSVSLTSHSSWIAPDSYGALHVVVSPNASESETLAADEFVSYWKQTTGHDVSKSDAPGKGVNVWIGREGLPDKLLSSLKLDNLGADGFHILTIHNDPPSLLIAGGTERGTLYGVYHFFEEYMGVRWLTHDVTYIPGAPPASLGSIDLRVVPAFQYRSTSYTVPWKDTHFERVHKLSGPSWGLFAHTVYDLVPPETYGASHPEYFSQVNGRAVVPLDFDWRDPAARQGRYDQLGQLNFAHPDVPAIIAAELERRIAEQPTAQYWSVSQMDWANYDRSDLSRAIDEPEDSPMASMLTCVNQVADVIAENHPHILVETLASGWSRTPPRTVEPRDNVVIRLSTVECDFARPLDDSKSNANSDFYADLAAWSRIAPNLFVWDYAANARNFQTPHPNLHVLQANLQAFARHGVKGVYVQGCPSPGGELAPLRTYILAKCLWDPDTDWQRHANEFLELYYAEAAPFIKEYINGITSKVMADETFLGAFDEGHWLDYDTVLWAKALFRDALDAAASDEIRQRVEAAYIPVQYAAMVCTPQIEFAPTQLALTRPSSPTLENYITLLRNAGVTEVGRWSPFDEIAAQLGGQSPPRREQLALERLENSYFNIWIVPEVAGSVIRWQDLNSNAELLQGYNLVGTGRGAIQDWVHTPGLPERPIANKYEVSQRSFDSITLRAVAASGLIVERKMTLKRRSDVLRVEFKLTNPTNEPIVPHLKLHPEFSVPGDSVPEIWIDTDSDWQHLNSAEDPGSLVGGEYVDAGPARRWAVRIPSLKLTIVNSFDDDVGSLFYFYNVRPDTGHVNLELIAAEEPIAPGKSRTIDTRYRVTGKPPQRL